MPPNSLNSISVNRPRKSELTPYERGIIMRAQALDKQQLRLEKVLILANQPFRPSFRDSQRNHNLYDLRCFLTELGVVLSDICEPIHGSPIYSCI